MKNKLFKISLIIFITLLLNITIVYATTYLYNSNEVSYDNSNSTLTKTNVQEALDELYNKCSTPATECPDGYDCEKIYKCKRVTNVSELHTETCTQTSNYCYADGYYASGSKGTTTITYGQVGTEGELNTGDAFDCKVSTSGDYTERFYYVSDYYDTTTKTFNSDIGVLIYHSNTLDRINSNNGASYDSYNRNWLGPGTAVTHLPFTGTGTGTGTWSNISLYKESRQILAQNDATATTGGPLTSFSYSGRAARLLTYQEVQNGCYDGSTAITLTGGLSSKCNFLFEKTKYSSSGFKSVGPWLETPYSSSGNQVWNINSSSRLLGISSTNSVSNGVRPVIEVPKSDISY